MKGSLKKLYGACLKLVPVCAAFMMVVSANSTGSWINGQEEMPKNAKKYRKF